jgi:predicted Rossmann fold flavoprotein
MSRTAPSRPSVHDALIVGAGAAGLMTAISAGQLGARVLVIDHNKSAGAKILISGGGRCNFTNLDVRPDCYISRNPHFAKSALARYKPADFIALVEKHGIGWHEKTLGQLFCDTSAKAIVSLLMREAQDANVEFAFGDSVTAVSRDADGLFHLDTPAGRFSGRSLVLASGGLSIPKLGASDFAYRTARQFGLKIIEPRPALVPLLATAEDIGWVSPLAGVALPCTAATGRRQFAEAMLFTHRGLSGPAILQISSYLPPSGGEIALDMLPDEPGHDWILEAKRSRPRSQLKTLLTEKLPSRLAAMLCEKHFTDRVLADMPDRQLIGIAEKLHRWPFPVGGTEGFAKAEVTVGGVDTDALSSRTLEAATVPGLYVVGEAADVTGWLGGYNFQWAWASGWVAGQAIAERTAAL